MQQRQYKGGFENFRKNLAQTISKTLRAPTNLSLSEWANTYARMPKESAGSNAGKFNAIPYQIGMMDAVTDRTVSKITVMKSARVGYTVMLNNIVGFYIHQEPAAMLLVQPTVEDAEDYSRQFIAPMIRDTPCLKEIAGDAKAKDSNQRVGKRVFPNGSWIQFIGANSPSGFRRITAQVVLFDEVDGFPASGAGEEGDQIALGTKRTTTEWNSKIILGSTPTVKGVSRIEKSFEDSDKRYYHVPCPHCEEMQTLDWANLRFDARKDAEGNPLKDARGKTIYDTANAYFACKHNGCIIEEKYKGAMIAKGQWMAEKPFDGHAGFFIWAAYSVFPKVTWASIAKEFLSVKNDPVQLKPFLNTVLGQTWEEQGKTIEASSLQARRDAGQFDLDTIPTRVKLLTAGVDVQGNRLELTIIGWAAKEESFILSYQVLFGDPTQDDVWNRLTAILKDTYDRQDEHQMRIRATCIDSGNGNHTERVYAYAEAQKHMNVYATKGASTSGNPIWPNKLSQHKTQSYRWAIIGTNAAKSAIYDRLEITKPGQGYINISETIEDDFLKMLTVEKKMIRYRAGVPYHFFHCSDGERNEALDCFVMAMAAYKSTGLARKLGRMDVETEAEAPQEPQDTDLAPTAPVEPPAPLPPALEPPKARTDPRQGFRRTGSRPMQGWLSK